MASPSLELCAAQAGVASRLMETAVHDAGPWSMQWGEVSAPASRTVQGGGVSFSAAFPEVCWLERPQTGISLLCRDEVVGVREMPHPGDTGFLVRWSVGMEVAAAA